MRKVIITGTPPQDWIAEADAVHAQLVSTTDQEARNYIIKHNEGLWRDDRIRNWLLAQFANKCWYTEAKESVSSIHVDHFRPKGRVTESDGTHNDGYWWLAYNWTNYVISGQLINIKKNDVFPLFTIPRATSDWVAAQLATEAIILIDPRSDETRFISFEMCDEDSCIAVPAGGIEGEDLFRAERTIEILGLNRLTRLNSNRAEQWRTCMTQIADFQAATSTAEHRNLASVYRRVAVRNLKSLIGYNAEFSSVADACIRKQAPEPLIAQMFNP